MASNFHVQFKKIMKITRKNTSQKSAPSTSEKSEQNERDFPGYPSYPADEDLYSRSIEKSDIDPENPTTLKTSNSPADAPNHINGAADQTGSDLDIPGSELDDTQENIGSEDEENNHYSLGGDDKENLEES